MIFETERLYTRTWTMADIGSAKLLWGDPHVSKFIDIRKQLTKDIIKKKLIE